MQAQQPAEAIPVLDYAAAERRFEFLRRILRVAGLYLLAATVGALVFGSIGWALIPSRYTATALIYVQPSGGGQTRFGTRPNFLATEAATLESAALSKVARQNLVNRIQITQAQSDNSTVAAQVDRRSDLIRLSVTGPDPTAPPLVAGAILEAYRAQSSQASPIVIEVFEPPRVAVRELNRQLLAAFSVAGATVSLLLLRRRRLPATFVPA